MTNMAAYHFSQAIEKSVKATLNEAVKSGKIAKVESAYPNLMDTQYEYNQEYGFYSPAEPKKEKDNYEFDDR